MKGPQEPGWYQNPDGSGDLRYWDGQKWTSMMKGDGKSSSDKKTVPIPEQFADAVSVFDTASVFTRISKINFLNRCVIRVNVFFFMSILPAVFTPFGEFAIGGTKVISIVHGLGFVSVVVALLAASILLPAHAISRASVIKHTLTATCWDYRESRIEGEITSKDYKRHCQVLCIAWKKTLVETIRFAVFSIVSAVVAFFLRGFLVGVVGDLWANALVIVFLASFIPILDGLYGALVTTKIEKKGSDLHKEADELINGLSAQLLTYSSMGF